MQLYNYTWLIQLPAYKLLYFVCEGLRLTVSVEFLCRNPENR